MIDKTKEIHPSIEGALDTIRFKDSGRPVTVSFYCDIIHQFKKGKGTFKGYGKDMVGATVELETGQEVKVAIDDITFTDIPDDLPCKDSIYSQGKPVYLNKGVKT